MAQKETSSKSRRWLGLSGAAVLVASEAAHGLSAAWAAWAGCGGAASAVMGV